MSIQCHVIQGLEGFGDAGGTKAPTFRCAGYSPNKGAQAKRHPYLPTKPSTRQSHVHLEEAVAFSNLLKGSSGPV